MKGILQIFFGIMNWKYLVEKCNIYDYHFVKKKSLKLSMKQSKLRKFY
jgi:hypothetical protein